MKPFLAKRIHLIDKSKRILELGCGDGADAFSLAEQGYSIEAVDHSPSAIQQARKTREEKRIQNMSLSCMNIQEFPFRRRQYGTMIALHVLHFLTREERSILVDKMKNSTSPGGVHFLAMFTPNGKLAENDEVSFIKKGEFEAYYSDWKILFLQTKMMPLQQCSPEGEAEQHEVLFFLAQRPA